MVAYEMLSQKVDLPQLLQASRKTGDVEKVLLETTGKRVVDYAPLDVRKALGEPEPPTPEARERR